MWYHMGNMINKLALNLLSVDFLLSLKKDETLSVCECLSSYGFGLKYTLHNCVFLALRVGNIGISVSG